MKLILQLGRTYSCVALLSSLAPVTGSVKKVKCFACYNWAWPGNAGRLEVIKHAVCPFLMPKRITGAGDFQSF